MKKIYYVLFMIVCIGMMSPLSANQGITLSWDLMSQLNIESGEMPDTLRKFDGKILEVTGFIVPLELDEYIDKVKEFLLVPDPFSCYHVPPPPLNQIIHVSMKKAIPLDMDFRGVTIKGKLSISPHEYDTKLMSFKLTGLSAKKAQIDMQGFYDPDMNLEPFDIPYNN